MSSSLSLSLSPTEKEFYYTVGGLEAVGSGGSRWECDVGRSWGGRWRICSGSRARLGFAFGKREETAEARIASFHSSHPPPWHLINKKQLYTAQICIRRSFPQALELWSFGGQGDWVETATFFLGGGGVLPWQRVETRAATTLGTLGPPAFDTSLPFVKKAWGQDRQL